jgi:pectin methylesterase-like acyl-CoA thioesterase
VSIYNLCLSREKIVVPADKPFITLSGTQPSDTIITWNDGGNIMESPTLTVLASDFVGRYLTIQVLSCFVLPFIFLICVVET